MKRLKPNTVAYGIALAAHAALAGALMIPSAQYPQVSPNQRLNLRLPPPREREVPPMMLASLPRPAPEPDPTPQPTPPVPLETPEPTPSQPKEPTPTPGGISDEVRDELARERRNLQAEIDESRKQALALADEAARSAKDQNARSLSIASGGVGTIRELDFSGWPQAVVDELMNRYRMRIVKKSVPAGSNQSYLSSAESSAGDVYYADRNHRGGYHEVFELSRKSVAVMSKLEENEIRKRNMDLSRTRVKRVKFGITQTAPGQYDIGIIEFQAETLP